VHCAALRASPCALRGVARVAVCIARRALRISRQVARGTRITPATRVSAVIRKANEGFTACIF
jgi:hypothetical protein